MTKHVVTMRLNGKNSNVESVCGDIFSAVKDIVISKCIHPMSSRYQILVWEHKVVTDIISIRTNLNLVSVKVEKSSNDRMFNNTYDLSTKMSINYNLDYLSTVLNSDIDGFGYKRVYESNLDEITWKLSNIRLLDLPLEPDQDFIKLPVHLAKLIQVKMLFKKSNTDLRLKLSEMSIQVYIDVTKGVAEMKFNNAKYGFYNGKKFLIKLPV